MQTIKSSLPYRPTILGSTGSIGRQTLDVVCAFPEAFQVVTLVARNKAEMLCAQAYEFRPALVVCTTSDQEMRCRTRELPPAEKNLQHMGAQKEHVSVPT